MIKNLLKGIFLIGIMFQGLEGRSQDIHFSQYNAAPLQLNPALAGFSGGDYRVYAIFRLQWPTISGGYTYRTFAGGADMAIGKITKFNSYAGIGISFFSDQAGAIDYSSNRINLTFAYHFMLNKKATQQISAGVQGSANYNSIDPSKATFDNQYDPTTGQINPTIPGESFVKSRIFYADAGLGLLYSGLFKHDIDFYSGFALDHVNQPSISFFPYAKGESASFVANERLDMKVTLHGGIGIPMSKTMTLMPNYAVFVQGPAYEFDLGCNLKTMIGDNIKSQTTAIHFGVQYRGLLDAIILSTRLDYKGFSGGLSYDVNISKLLPASKTIGAPEISLVYQGWSRKKPRPGHCPEMF